MISWSDSFATGVPRVDLEHQKLVGMLNELEQAIQTGRGSQVINTIVSGLATYSATHFSYEENCMEQYKCPMAAQNKQAHAQFMTVVAKARTRLANGGNALAAQQVHRELCDWVINHVLKVDSALKGCVKQLKSA